MKRNILFIMFCLLPGVVFSTTSALAEEGSEKDISDTMTVVEENQTPADIDKMLTVPDTALSEDIKLPGPASEQGGENSAYGLDKANETRQRSRETARERIHEARQEQLGEQLREQARESVMEKEMIRQRIQDRREEANNR